jgi:hypothetical protein
MMRRPVTLLLAVLLGCSGHAPAITLQGEPMSIRSLAGEWAGEYWSASSERRGMINFSLAAGADTAYGDVLMFAPLGQPLRAADRPEQHMIQGRQAQSLRIEFVRVGLGSMVGVLEPYVAPDCDCRASTQFAGAVFGDTIRGTFVTTTEHATTRDGRWFVIRRAGSAP